MRNASNIVPKDVLEGLVVSSSKASVSVIVSVVCSCVCSTVVSACSSAYAIYAGVTTIFKDTRVIVNNFNKEFFMRLW